MEIYVPNIIAKRPGLIMIKYETLNEHINSHPIKLTPGDQVNVFINFEIVLRNLSFEKSILDRVNFHKKKLILEVESSILNIIAHYKTYFNGKYDTKIYFYYTDLGFRKQQMSVYNKYYRSYYQNRYMQNPQFKSMGTIMKNIIIPEVELILSYIPNSYFLKSKTFDSSVIPQIVSSFSEAKNIIITSDIFDTLYLFNPNFIVVYDNRKFAAGTIMSEIDPIVRSVIKHEDPFDLGLFHSELYYKLLLSVKGNKIRNIISARGFGYGKLLKLLKDGIDSDIVLRDFESIDSVIELFPEKFREDIKTAFQCTDIGLQYSLLSETDIDEIKNQIVDKVDTASLEALNNKRFAEFPLNLAGLITE